MASNHHNHVTCTQQPTAASTPVGGLAREARRALAVAAVLAFGIGVDVYGGPINSSAYRIDVTSNPVWYDSSGKLVAQGGSTTRLSARERRSLQSQPIVSITNLSTDTSLVGIQLDLSNSASKIVSCTWLEAPATSSWNWHDPSASALFQFRDPIAPGAVVTMRLGTAARPNSQGLTYAMNQTLFQPSIGDCLTTNSSCGAFTLFFRPLAQTAIPTFDSSGRPVLGGSATQAVGVANAPILGEEAISLSAVSSVVVPVPEPGTLALAVSALGLVAGLRGLRRKAA